MVDALHITGDTEADALLTEDPLALLIGMLLDQQVPMETAFAGPAKIRDRMGGVLNPRIIAEFEPEAFAELCKRPPAAHRFPGSLAGRSPPLCAAVADDWGGDASAIWRNADGAEVLARLKALPGFGDQKAKIFLA